MRSNLRRIIAVFLCTGLLPTIAAAQGSVRNDRIGDAIAELEAEHGGRIGLAALNLADGERLEYRADERFALCSTFKLLLVAAVLARVDAHDENLGRLIAYGPDDLLDYAPITSERMEDGAMSVSSLAAAAVQYSDNTAANLLLANIGGPAGLTRYLRSLGDSITRLDRNEPSLNSNQPGDLRDTTTPHAMVGTMRRLLVEDALSPDSRQRLTDWLIGNTTGDDKLRAGLNPAWTVGDKTGSGGNGASNDVAIVWPSAGPPFLIAVYYSESSATTAEQNEIIASVGRLVGAMFDRS